MLSASWKSPARRWACYGLALALGTAVALLVCPMAEAQTAPPPAGQAQTAPAPAPSPAVKTPAPAAQTPAPVKPEKPPAPRLNRSYAQLFEPSPAEEKEYLKTRSAVKNWLRAGSISPDQEKTFIDYYNKYALARWTYVKRQHEAEKNRSELRGDFAISYKPNQGNQAHGLLSKLVLERMKLYVNPAILAQPKYNFSPATRFNAILMIGELNEAEAGTIGRPAKPLPEALGILLTCATDPRQIDAVRLGAFIGIRRHCRLMMEADIQVPRSVLNAMATLAMTKEPERVRSADGQAWMRSKAVQIFADVKGEPAPQKVAEILRGIVAEQETPDFLRYEAAAALGSVDYRKAAGADMNGLLHTLGLLAVRICDEERQRLRDEMESEKSPASASGYGGSYAGSSDMGMEGSSGGYEEMSEYGSGGMRATSTDTQSDRQIERARSRLQEGMGASLTGMGKRKKTAGRNNDDLSGLLVLAGGDIQKKQSIENFSDPIHDFFKIIDTKDDDDKQIQAKALDEAIAEVRQLLADALSQVGPPAPESPEFEPLPEPRPAGAYGGSGDMMMSGEY